MTCTHFWLQTKLFVPRTIPFSDVQKNEISKILKVFGFELIDDKKSKTIDKIKTVIIDLVQNKNNDLKINL